MIIRRPSGPRRVRSSAKVLWCSFSSLERAREAALGAPGAQTRAPTPRRARVAPTPIDSQSEHGPLLGLFWRSGGPLARIFGRSSCRPSHRHVSGASGTHFGIHFGSKNDYLFKVFVCPPGGCLFKRLCLHFCYAFALKFLLFARWPKKAHIASDPQKPMFC